MKCMFLSASRYSINNSIVKGFNENGWEISVVDYYDFFRKITNRFLSKTGGLPDKVKKYWETPFLKAVNAEYLRFFEEYNPDLVFVYNNQQVSPETIQVFKQKSKIAFILGDNPLYSRTNPYNAHILFFADYIICPDTFWIQQLRRIGIKNLYFDCFGFDPDIYFPFQPTQAQLSEYGSDIIYVGIAHKDSPGYKRFLFLNNFRLFNLRLYMNGNGYKKHWHSHFPEISKHLTVHEKYDPSFNNLVYNCSKIAPADLPPAIFNGIHVRVFDALGAGILPLCEHSQDLDIVFEGIDYPAIRSYNDIKRMTSYYLEHEDVRKHLAAQMRERVSTKYLPKTVIKRLLMQVYH